METFLIYLMGYLLVVSTEYKSTTQALSSHYLLSLSYLIWFNWRKKCPDKYL